MGPAGWLPIVRSTMAPISGRLEEIAVPKNNYERNQT